MHKSYFNISAEEEVLLKKRYDALYKDFKRCGINQDSENTIMEKDSILRLLEPSLNLLLSFILLSKDYETDQYIGRSARLAMTLLESVNRMEN